jgi:hypothetical protein
MLWMNLIQLCQNMVKEGAHAYHRTPQLGNESHSLDYTFVAIEVFL